MTNHVATIRRLVNQRRLFSEPGRTGVGLPVTSFFVLPFMTLFTIFTLIPHLYSMYMSYVRLGDFGQRAHVHWVPELYRSGRRQPVVAEPTQHNALRLYDGNRQYSLSHWSMAIGRRSATHGRDFPENGLLLASGALGGGHGDCPRLDDEYPIRYLELYAGLGWHTGHPVACHQPHRDPVLELSNHLVDLRLPHADIPCGIAEYPQQPLRGRRY